MLIMERGWLSVANSAVLSVAVPIVLPSTSSEDLTPGSLPESGRSSAASVDEEGEQENGEREKSVSPHQSPTSPHPTTLSDGLGSGITGFDSQVKRSPSDKVPEHSPSGVEDEKETKPCSPDVDAPSRNIISMDEQKDGEDEDKDREDAVDDEETGDTLVCSSVAPSLTSQKDDRFDGEHQAPSHLSMTPEEAKKRGLSFDYTEPQDPGQQSAPAGWECSSDKTPPESRSPDSCRADPGSPLSPSGAAEPTHEESSLKLFQTDAREEEEDVPEQEEEEDESSIPPCSQEMAEPKMEAESGEHIEPEEAKEDKQDIAEKYLETSDDLIEPEKAVQNHQSVAKPDAEAAQTQDTVKPSAQVMPSKTAPIKESPAKKPKKPVATVAATPSPKSAPKLQKAPSKDAAPARKTSVPSKGLFSVLFLNLPTASSSITDILFIFPFSFISSRAVDLAAPFLKNAHQCVRLKKRAARSHKISLSLDPLCPVCLSLFPLCVLSVLICLCL